jgi:hypothetical protein
MRTSTHTYHTLNQTTAIADRLPLSTEGQLLFGDVQADADYIVLTSDDPTVFDRIATAATSAAARMRAADALHVTEINALLGGAS